MRLEVVPWSTLSAVARTTVLRRQPSSEASIAREGIATMTDIINIGHRLPRRGRKDVVEQTAPDAAAYHIALEATPASADSERTLSGARRRLWRRRWLLALGAVAGGAV